MASCKECIHERVCFALIKSGLPYLDDEFPAEAFCMTFKDKSKIVELPCGVGDTVYVPTSNGIINEEVNRILYSQEAENHSKFIRERFYTNTETQFDFLDFGKSVFFTYEEAEKALKECKNSERLD